MVLTTNVLAPDTLNWDQTGLLANTRGTVRIAVSNIGGSKVISTTEYSYSAAQIPHTITASFTTLLVNNYFTFYHNPLLDMIIWLVAVKLVGPGTLSGIASTVLPLPVPSPQ